MGNFVTPPDKTVERGAEAHLNPCILRDWPHFEIAFRHTSARYEIRVENPHRVCRGVAHVELDGKTLPAGETRLVLVDDGRTHEVVILGG
jgi:cyclic beta-1,2-glucan synthetase